MRIAPVVVGAVALSLGLATASGAASFRQNDFGQTVQSKRHCQGAGCGAATGHDCGPSSADISPNAAVGKVGQPIELKFDCTAMCNGQTAKRNDGYVKWDAGFKQSIPDSYGWASNTYATGGSYSVEIRYDATCSDPGGKSDCTCQGTVPVTIQP